MLPDKREFPDLLESAWYFEAMQEAINSHEYERPQGQDYEHWTKIIPRMLHYFEKNLSFYEKALLITENNSFDSCFSDQIQQFIKSILLESNNANCSTDQLEKNTHFYAYGFTGIIKEWIFDKCQTPAKEIEDFLISVVESTIIKKDSNS